MLEHWQEALAALVVLTALAYLVGHFTGAIERFRRKRSPDVPVSRLVRGKRPKSDDDCCR